MGDQRPSNGQLDFPKTDYAFQTTLPDSAVAASPGLVTETLAQARTFRNVSRHFGNQAAAREYLAEALFFAWITVTAAWPIGLLVRQLSSLTLRP